MIKAGIIGASGFTGYELIKILDKHKHVQLDVVNSTSVGGKSVKSEYPDYKGDVKFTNYTIDQINSMCLDVVFLALPHTVAMEYVPKLSAKIIDLSADYRFKDFKKYEKVYGLAHTDTKSKAVYGLGELFKSEIKKAELVANPGCYATGMLLCGLPIDNYADYIIFDCKSGWSGAGRNSIYAKDDNLLKDNIIAYKLTKHRHKYEVEQFLKTKVSFTPQVIDTYQGMMIIAHVMLTKKMTESDAKKIYQDMYKDNAFVKVVDDASDLHGVQGTNKVKIGGFEIDENGQMVVVGVLDNLIKGASGQAVQNMNMMFGLNEMEGLK